MSKGVNGPAVAIAALGGVLVYAGFRGVSPLQALRDISNGEPPAVESKPYVPTASAGASGRSGLGDSRRSAVVSAAQSYRGDRYSQARRTQPGYSDCSSFVSKALVDAGIDPPGSKWANTTNYRLSGQWRTIPASQAQPGDIAISIGHMVLVTAAGGGQAIGQQNSRTNVREGSTASLFSRKFIYRTWSGYTKSAGSGSGSGGGGGGSW